MLIQNTLNTMPLSVQKIGELCKGYFTHEHGKEECDKLDWKYIKEQLRVDIEWCLNEQGLIKKVIHIGLHSMERMNKMQKVHISKMTGKLTGFLSSHINQHRNKRILHKATCQRSTDW